MYGPKHRQWLFSAVVLAALVVSVLPPVSTARAQNPDPTMPAHPVPPPAAPTTASIVCPEGQFLAQYYNNTSFTPPAALERCEDAPLAYDGTAAAAPGVNTTNFTARYTGTFHFDAAKYRFLLRQDDSVWLLVDGSHVYTRTAWISNPLVAYVTPSPMTAGAHSIQIDFFQGGGAWSLFAGWVPELTGACPINQLRADYYTGISATGTPLFSRCEEPPVHYSWGGTGPYGFRAGNFSVHWTGTVDSNVFPPGDTRYTGQVSGHVLAKVDNAQIFDLTNQLNEQRSDTTVSGATHSIDVTYNSTVVPAMVHFAWNKGPEACGVPLKTEIGRDEELLAVNASMNAYPFATNHEVNPGYGWRPGEHCCYWLKGADAVRLDDDAQVIVGLGGSNRDDVGYGLTNALGQEIKWEWVGLKARATAVVSRHPGNFVIFSQPLNDDPATGGGIDERYMIRYREATVYITGTVQLGTWQYVPGVTNAGTGDGTFNIAVVSPDMNTMLLFYKDSAKHVWFTKWTGGVWQDAPVQLNLTFNSPVTAIAASSDYAFLFGVGTDSHPYVKTWTSANKADWSDATLSGLGTMHCQTEQIAAVASDPDHVAAACRGTDNIPYSWQWTPAGWSVGARAGSLATMTTGPLTLAAPEPGKLWLVWADRTSVYRMVYSQGAWSARAVDTRYMGGTAAIDPGRVIAVVSQPGWVNNYVYINDAYHVYQWKWLDTAFTETNSAAAQYGVPRGEALVKVGEKTILASTYLDSSKRWQLVLSDPDPASPTGGQAYATRQLVQALSTSNWQDGLEGLAHGDYDADGDEELAIFLRESTAQTTAKLFRVDMSWSSSTLNATVTSQTICTGTYSGATCTGGTASFVGPVSAAIGDLDGDGKASELVLGAYMTGWKPWLFMYQWDGQNFRNWLAEDLGTAGYDQGADLQIAAGRVRNLDGEQVVLTITECPDWTNCNWRNSAMVIYQYSPVKSQQTGAITGWQKTFLVLGEEHSKALSCCHGVGGGGPFSSALALGDVDGDGLKEIVYSNTNAVFVYGGDVAAGSYRGYDDPYYPERWVYWWGWQDAEYGNRSLAMGDLDRDGEAEVYLITGIYEWLFDWYRPRGATGWLNVEKITSRSYGPYVALIGDIDNDSALARLAGCQTVTNGRVLAVVYEPPRYYDASTGESLQSGSSSYTMYVTEEEGSSTGVTFSTGLSIELELEWDAGLFGLVGSKTSLTVGNEFEYSWNRTVERSHSVEESVGYNLFDGGGSVVYSSSSQTCYFYDLVYPGGTTAEGRAVACDPGGQPSTDHMSVSDWNTDRTRKAWGGRWFPLDRSNKEVHTYPAVIPAGYGVVWEGAKQSISGTDNPSCGGGDNYQFGVNFANTTSEITSNSWMDTTSIAVGVGWKFNAFGVASNEGMLKVGTSFGAGGESGHSVSWGKATELTAGICQPDHAACPGGTCPQYWVKPYVANVAANTLSGIQYPYLAFDYTTPCAVGAPSCSASGPEEEADALRQAQGPDAAEPDSPGAAPLAPLAEAPIVTSPTHPDPNTWYTSNDVTFNWQQPAGDPAPALGYRWLLNEQPDTQPFGMAAVQNTATYPDVRDGVHYMHVAAAGGGLAGSGPSAHRAVRVDANAPKVKIVLDPPSPNGTGWFNKPVIATVSAGDGTGSGVASIEYSTDGITWQAYSGPLTFSAETAGFTLSARATDGVGHVSGVAQVPIKIDTTPPSTVDVDGYGLSYARIDQDESGNNVQLVLGGALNDNLSGRDHVAISAGEGAAWHAVDAVGVFPMPPGNLFPPGQATTLNWIYTPTFEIRGVYNLYDHGVDVAGNVETGWGSAPIGTLFWPPDGNPNLAESRLTASPSVAKAGDTVRFTLGLRNSGVQEAAVMITATVPAGLTVLPESINAGGQYDAASRQVRWRVHAAWPNQLQYLIYAATVNAGSSGQLTTQAALMAYWPGYENDPSKVFHSTLSNIVTVPAGAAPTGPLPPEVIDARILEGPAVGDPNITLSVLASPSAQYLYVKEWTLDPVTTAWVVAHEGAWVPLTGAIEDGAGKRITYPWTLAASDGVHYLGIWTGDGRQQPSNLNEAGLVFTNLTALPTTLAAGLRTQYRLPLQQGDLAVLTLATTDGDADLFVWAPRDGFKPLYWSNGAGAPPAVDTIAFYAPESGDYLVEAHGVTDAGFVLALAGALKPASPEQENPEEPALPASVHNADKQRPDHPETLSTPFSLPGADVPGETVPFTPFKLYLPLVGKMTTMSGPAAPVAPAAPNGPAAPDAYPARQRTQ